MNQKEQLLRQLPKMDALLAEAEGAACFSGLSREAVSGALRRVLEQLRKDVLSGALSALPEKAELFCRGAALLSGDKRLSQRPVINATGVILHTNLGRALLAEEATEAVVQVARGYSSLEFNCETGKRGDRYHHVEGILRELVGSEAAIVVNNNAAGVMLVLSAMARGREVIVSRGELVEIGGSFRVPEVMEQSGCRLKEVGATNKTHLKDYVKAINEETGALLKVHTSNYRISGFTESVELEALSALAKEKNLPLLYDLGGGSMLPLSPYGVADEPTVAELVKKGADVICFSGDKLLGGPQAGIIVGKKHWIDQLKSHPLLRALRVDKMTLAALEATLRLYRYPEEAKAKIPLFQKLGEPIYKIEERGKRLLSLLGDIMTLQASLVESEAQIGAGSVPCETIPSRAVSLQAGNMDAEKLSHALLRSSHPTAARIHKDRLLLDMRTIRDEEVERLALSIREALEDKSL